MCSGNQFVQSVEILFAFICQLSIGSRGTFVFCTCKFKDCRPRAAVCFFLAQILLTNVIQHRVYEVICPATAGPADRLLRLCTSVVLCIQCDYDPLCI